ncbi:MAG: SelB C-terminal domain-containing protein, partial [Proteobacteria bacterium]|nr:SelB C-terminal domain-containing protein [Pseudomonadota bacterium]
LLLAPQRWVALREAVLAAVAADHAAHGDRLGPDAAMLVQDRALGAGRVLVAMALAALVAEGRLLRRGAVFHLPGHSVTLAAADSALWSRIEAALERDGATPPALYPLADAMGQPPGDLERFLERMAACGLVQKIGRNRWLTPTQIARFGEAAAKAAGAAGAEGFTAAQFRDAAGIGRNLAIDLLEFLDRSGITLRRGDLRQMAGSS